MKLELLLKQYAVISGVQYTDFLKPSTCAPLDLMRLELKTIVGETRLRIRPHCEGIGGVVLVYKDENCALASMDEAGDGWIVNQVQGVRSRRAYRVGAVMYWPDLLAEGIRTLAYLAEANVRVLSMKPQWQITNIVEAKSDRISETYERFSRHLGMHYASDHCQFQVRLPSK